jgi:hypothetical protein
MIDRPKTSNIQKINQTEQQIDEFQNDDGLDRFCRYESFGTKIT